MKLSLSEHFIKKDKISGFRQFGSLLSETLSHAGIQIVDEKQKSDIHLTAIHGNTKKGAKNVLRIDGVYYDTPRINLNNPIRYCIKNFDGVIFQSNWSHKMATKMLGVSPKKYRIIYNGTLQSAFLPKIKNEQFDKVFVSVASWRVNKRLKTIVDAFVKVLNDSSMNLGLYIVGVPDFKIDHPNVKFFGLQNFEKITQILAQSDYMCHICHIDSCPNSVVEGLSAGLPVICNNIGGTPEIVSHSGVHVKLDEPFSFKYIKSMDKVGPDSINYELLSEGMKEIMKKDLVIHRPDLDIKVSAQKYYDFFRSLLS